MGGWGKGGQGAQKSSDQTPWPQESSSDENSTATAAKRLIAFDACLSARFTLQFKVADLSSVCRNTRPGFHPKQLSAGSMLFLVQLLHASLSCCFSASLLREVAEALIDLLWSEDGQGPLGERSFQCIGPVIWNSLPIFVEHSCSISSFKLNFENLPLLFCVLIFHFFLVFFTNPLPGVHVFAVCVCVCVCVCV